MLGTKAPGMPLRTLRTAGISPCRDMLYTQTVTWVRVRDPAADVEWMRQGVAILQRLGHARNLTSLSG